MKLTFYFYKTTIMLQCSIFPLVLRTFHVNVQNLLSLLLSQPKQTKNEQTYDESDETYFVNYEKHQRVLRYLSFCEVIAETSRKFVITFQYTKHTKYMFAICSDQIDDKLHRRCISQYSLYSYTLYVYMAYHTIILLMLSVM